MIPAATRDRLAKLLPRLASEHDGEVLATARAIGRTLTAAGSDFHALAALICDTSASGINWSSFAADMAANFKPEPAAPVPDPDAPDARARRWGLPIWGVKKIEPWCVVAGHCLQLNWTIPKASGGKFLTKDERDRLRRIERYAPVTNADAAWIEAILVACHAVRDEWRSQPKAAA